MEKWSRERVAVAAYFAVLGLVCATWASSIDDMKLLLGLNDAQQGWLLFSGPLGNLVSFTFASALVTRLGSRRSLALATSVYLASALGIAVCFLLRAPFWLWCTAIAALGGTGNLFNISVNTQGGIVERRAGRTIMNSFHAMFSVMCLVAGLLALAASSVGLPPGWRLVGVLAVAAIAHLAFLPSLPTDNDVAKKARGEGLRRPDVALFLLGLAALVIMGCEGSINDWVNVFYRESLAAPDSRVKWGFCAVSAAMTVGRIVTDRLINRFGGRTRHCAFFAVHGAHGTPAPCPCDGRVCHRGIRNLRACPDSLLQGEQDEVHAGRLGAHLRRLHGIPRILHGSADDRPHRPCDELVVLPRHIRRAHTLLPVPQDRGLTHPLLRGWRASRRFAIIEA